MNTELALYQTHEYPCSYLPNRQAQSLMVAPDKVDSNIYSQLVALGFRRSGLHVYRPNCVDCNACTSIRIIADEFQPNRSQRRTFKKWADLTTQICELEFNPEHFDLYRCYQQTRHSEGSMANDNENAYQTFLLENRVDSFLVEFRNTANQLLMVSLIDRVHDGLSAVYTFYDTAHTGLGTYGILWQISVAQRLKLPYIYLGYWIDGSDKMAYKTNFSATQVLRDGAWHNHT